MVSFVVDSTGQRRFRFSTRTLMGAVALCAFVLALAVWNFRQLEALRMERLHAEHARALAEERAAVSARSAQAALAAAKLGSADQRKARSLWAGIGVNHPILKAGETRDLRIEFTLVNDGDEVIDPKIQESQIIVNGKELTDSGSILSSVQKVAHSEALSPGKSLQFDCLLGDRFKEPGIHRVSWKGSRFQSSEIVLRVLPKEAH